MLCTRCGEKEIDAERYTVEEMLLVDRSNSPEGLLYRVMHNVCVPETSPMQQLCVKSCPNSIDSTAQLSSPTGDEVESAYVSRVVQSEKSYLGEDVT